MKELNFIVLVYVVKILRQSVLFQKIGNGAVIKHEVDSTAEKTVEFFSLCIFGICEEARSRRIRKL